LTKGVTIVTGTQAFQFDVNAIIQMVLWGLVLVAVASAFVNFGASKKTDMLPQSPGQAHVEVLTEEQVREIVREEIAAALRPIHAALGVSTVDPMLSKSTTRT
jgi:hypothetical protein